MRNNLWAGGYHFRFFARAHMPKGFYDTFACNRLETARYDMAEYLKATSKLWGGKKIRVQVFENQEYGSPVVHDGQDTQWDMREIERLLANNGSKEAENVLA